MNSYSDVVTEAFSKMCPVGTLCGECAVAGDYSVVVKCAVCSKGLGTMVDLFLPLAECHVHEVLDTLKLLTQYVVQRATKYRLVPAVALTADQKAFVRQHLPDRAWCLDPKTDYAPSDFLRGAFVKEGFLGHGVSCADAPVDYKSWSQFYNTRGVFCLPSSLVRLRDMVALMVKNRAISARVVFNPNDIDLFSLDAAHETLNVSCDVEYEGYSFRYRVHDEGGPFNVGYLNVVPKIVRAEEVACPIYSVPVVFCPAVAGSNKNWYGEGVMSAEYMYNSMRELSIDWSEVYQDLITNNEIKALVVEDMKLIDSPITAAFLEHGYELVTDKPVYYPVDVFSALVDPLAYINTPGVTVGAEVGVPLRGFCYKNMFNDESIFDTSWPRVLHSSHVSSLRVLMALHPSKVRDSVCVQYNAEGPVNWHVFEDGHQGHGGSCLRMPPFMVLYTLTTEAADFSDVGVSSKDLSRDGDVKKNPGPVSSVERINDFQYRVVANNCDVQFVSNTGNVVKSIPLVFSQSFLITIDADDFVPCDPQFAVGSYQNLRAVSIDCNDYHHRYVVDVVVEPLFLRIRLSMTNYDLLPQARDVHSHPGPDWFATIVFSLV